jgi:hypothetical protein
MARSSVASRGWLDAAANIPTVTSRIPSRKSSWSASVDASRVGRFVSPAAWYIDDHVAAAHAAAQQEVNR